MTEQDMSWFQPRVQPEYDGPLDVWIQNEDSDEWLFAGVAEPYGKQGKTTWGWRYPDYGQMVTGSSHKLRARLPGEGPTEEPTVSTRSAGSPSRSDTQEGSS